MQCNNNEKEFLNKYDIANYERPSLASDIVLFAIRSESENSYRHEPENHLSILLIKRGEYPYKDCWALPGGFMRGNETIEECAYRELIEETGVHPTALMNIGIFSGLERDPRGRVVSSAFLSITKGTDEKIECSNDAFDVKWFDVSLQNDVLILKNDDVVLKSVLNQSVGKFGKTEFDIIDNGGLAFDHAEIIVVALEFLRHSVNNFELIFDFLPPKFTLTEVQKVQETILDTSVIPANFRRKIANYVSETQEYTSGAGHRPAKLFTKKKES